MFIDFRKPHPVLTDIPLLNKSPKPHPVLTDILLLIKEKEKISSLSLNKERERFTTGKARVRLFTNY